MIGDPLKKVTTGQPFVPSAASWNAFADAARAHLQKQSSSAKPYRPAAGNRATVALVQNTDSGVGRFGILSITGPIVDPGTNLNEFSNYLAFQCGAVQVNTPFVITLEPIASNGVGLAVIAGACPCQVQMLSATDMFADVTNYGAGLVSGNSGTLQVLWAATASSYPATCWAVVRFGAPPPPAQFAKVVSIYPGGCMANPFKTDGTVDTTVTLGLAAQYVGASNTAGLLPNLVAGDVVRYQPDAGARASGTGNNWPISGWILGDVFLPRSMPNGPIATANMSLTLKAASWGDGGSGFQLQTDWPRES